MDGSDVDDEAHRHTPRVPNSSRSASDGAPGHDSDSKEDAGASTPAISGVFDHILFSEEVTLIAFFVLCDSVDLEWIYIHVGWGVCVFGSY